MLPTIDTLCDSTLLTLDGLALQGDVKAGHDFMYSSQSSAYAKEPWETVNYADCHDGQTLFDQVPYPATWGILIFSSEIKKQIYK